MFKKVIISIILALTIICGANVAITTAFAAEEGETETVNYKVSYVSFAETFSGEYTANTPIVFKDGDNEVGVLKFDQSSVPGEISGGKSKFLSGTSLSFVPKNDYIVTKLVYTGEGFPSFKTSDTAHVTIEKPTSDEKALIKESFNVGSDGFAGALLDRTHVATEEDPYKCVFSSFAKLGAVFVIYEEKQTGNVGDITHDCTTDKSSSSPATVKVGDATFLIRYDGTFYGGYPARATGGAFSITIYPVPGNVINYVIFTSPTDNPLDTNELKFSEGLEATYDNGNLKVTGMQPGQTYTINSDGGAEGLLTSITVNYQEHEHSAPYTSGSDETYHFDQCVCLWRVNEEEHTFGEGTQTSEPTSKKPGTIEYTCSTCNYVKKEAVAPNLADTVVELTRKEFKYNGDGLVAAINNLYYKGENVSSSNYKRTGTTIAKTPGTYSFTIIPADGSIFVGEKVVTFTIEKGDYDMSKVVFEDMTVDYNGSAQSILATNLPKGVTVTYENNEQTDAGEYTIIAKFTLNTDDAQYYNPIENLTATLKINKASVAKPTADDTVFTYNGQEQTYVLETSDLYNVLDNTATIAGNHTVKVALVDKNNYQWENGNSNDIEYSFVINKATYNMDSVVFEDKTVIYNGSEFSIEATNLPNGVSATYENNEQTDAGEYTVTAKFTGDANNYELIANKTAVLTIKQVVVTAPIADDTAFTYNGQEQTYVLEASSLYNVLDNTATIAGNHTVKVALIDKNNYKWNNGNSNDLTYSFVINKATYNMEGVVFADKTVTYNGTEFSIEATNLPNGVSVTYENNGKTDAGEYVITAKFTGDANNYELIADKTAKLTINKATYNMEGVVFADKTVTYNGGAFSIEATNLPNGVSVTYENNEQTDAGEYTVTAKFTGDANNYELIADKTAKLTINKATYNMDGVVFANKTVTYNGGAFSIEATNLPNGVTITYENNGKINVGEYTITAKFTGNANYNDIADKTAKLTINKATYNMDGVVFANKTVTYNGSEFSIEATNLPNGVTVTYENNGKINVGEYTITAKFTGNANYNDIADKTATLTIEKAVVTVPTADSTAFTYNGQPQTYALQGNVLYTISNTTFTNAGSYNIAVTLKDKNNYKWNNGNSNDLTYSFVINKATYNMNGVVFANKTVVYSGSAFSIEATNLPNGVTVTYENNGKTDAGVYTVTAKFTGDADNYELITDKTATLTINKALISFDTNNEDDIANDIIISSNDGIDPTKELVVKLVESEKPIEDYKGFISKTQKVAVSYDVKLLKDGISVQPDGTLQFKVLIPAELVGKNFDIIHIHNGNEVSVLEYQIDGDYVTFESDKLSEFVFVYDIGSILWVIIVLGVVALLEIAFLVFLSKKNKEIKSKKLMSAYPPFLFGMFIAEWEIVLAIVLVVVVIVLAIVSIIFAMKVLNAKTQDATENEEVSVTKDTNVEQIVEEDDDNDEKEGRIVKSFSERLSNCSLETINYYNDIKNELLSYKKVKSKISLKHESFRFGMPVVARLKIRGKSLYLFLALDPNDYIDTKYKIKDMSAISNSKDVPTMYKINLPRRVIYAKELIKDLMENIKAEKNN